MFAREFTYPGYDNQPHKETWWFNLSDAELAEMELGTVSGLEGTMRRLIRENKPAEVVNMFKKLILKAVGERSIDGRRFVKRERPGMPWGEVAEDFYETPAYSQLFTELVSDPNKFVEFLMKAIPEETAKKIRQLQEAEKAEKEIPEGSVVQLPVGETTDAP